EILRQAEALAAGCGARLGIISEGANSAGLALAGVLPHRGPGGVPRPRTGRSVADMVSHPPAGLVLVNVEPHADVADGLRAAEAAGRAGFVLALSPWLDESLKTIADVVLPVGTYAETAGSFVNAEGRWQSFTGVASPVGESRPAWKVLRVL